MKRFFCDKCGKCCEKLPALVIDPGLDDGTGKCKFYDSQTNLCTIYDQRPDICNVDKMYSAFASLMSYATMINALIAMFHGMFSDATTAMEEKLYEVKTRKILSYSNIVASSSNLAIVAITKDFHKLDLGGLAVTIYRLITDRKFIRQVKEEFIFGSYKDMIMNDYI